MKAFFQRYIHFSLITSGMMFIGLFSLMMGRFTVSVIFGHEITDTTLRMAGGFVVLAPAFLALISSEEILR